MKKLLALVLSAAFACSAFQICFAQESKTTLAPGGTELARVDAAATTAAKLAQYEQAIPLIIRQRTEADAMVRDLQVQAALLAGENESLKKQLAEAQAKVAELTKPKEAKAAAVAQEHVEKSEAKPKA